MAFILQHPEQAHMALMLCLSSKPLFFPVQTTMHAFAILSRFIRSIRSVYEVWLAKILPAMWQLMSWRASQIFTHKHA